MSVRLYDEALWNKIESLFPDKHLMVLKPDETARLFKTRALNTSDKPIKLPLLAISRDPNVEMVIPTKRNLTFDGVHIKESSGNIAHLDVIPIKLRYQIDIYTKTYALGDEYIRELAFYFVNNPEMYITFMYNGVEVSQKCYVEVEPVMTDNSDIPEKMFSDQFTRWSIYLNINDAKLYSIPISTEAKIESVNFSG